MAVQIVGYWEDATEFPYGPFVAVAHPMSLHPLYRIEQRAHSGKGTMFVVGNHPRGWRTLDELTPVIEQLNAAKAEGK